MSVKCNVVQFMHGKPQEFYKLQVWNEQIKIQCW
jgi:hypothetical protein